MLSANTSSSQVLVKGWKKVYDADSTTVWVNNEYFRIAVTDYALTLSKNAGYTDKITLTGALPDVRYYSTTSSSIIEARLTPNGKIQFRNNNSSNNYDDTISTVFFGKLATN